MVMLKNSRLPEQSPLLVSHKDLEQAAKAVYDATEERLGGQLGGMKAAVAAELSKAIDGEIKRKTADLSIEMGKLLGQHVKDAFAQMEASVKDRLGALEQRMVEMGQRTAALDARDSASAKSLADKIDDSSAAYGEMLKSLHGEMQRNLMTALGQFGEIVKALPPSQVTVPEGAIRVDVKQQDINFSVPEKSIHVDVVPQEVNFRPRINVEKTIVNVPRESIKVDVKQQGINFSPQIAAPLVELPKHFVLEMPERETTKSIQYDSYGRPCEVHERQKSIIESPKEDKEDAEGNEAVRIQD